MRARAGIPVDFGPANADNEVMSSVPHTQISLPTELIDLIEPEARASGMNVDVFLAQFVQRAQAQARDMGMTMNTYLHFIANVAARRHDTAFVDAVRQTMTHYPAALKKLAQ